MVLVCRFFPFLASSTEAKSWSSVDIRVIDRDFSQEGGYAGGQYFRIFKSIGMTPGTIFFSTLGKACAYQVAVQSATTCKQEGRLPWSLDYSHSSAWLGQSLGN